MDNYDLIKHGDQWKLQKQGSQRASKTFDTKREGMAFSTQHVRQKGGSLKIHKENGQYQEERTYPRSADPRRTPG